MSSKGDIFDKISPSHGDVFDKISSSQEEPLFGEKGKLIGGKVGRAIKAGAEKPSLVVTEAPVALAKAAEAPLAGVEALTEGAQKLFGSKFPTPKLVNTSSEFLKKYVRSHLSEEEKAGAEDISDIEAFLVPFIKGRGAKGIPKIEQAKVPPSGPKPDSVQRMFQERSTFSPEKGAAITEDVKKVGQAVKKEILGPNISEEIPKAISPQRIRNSTTAGMELEKAVASPYKKLSALEKKAYDLSRAENQAIEAIHPELVGDLENSLVELQKIPDPSAPLKRYIDSTKKVINDLAERAPDGSVVGYKPISNQTLINQIQEYNQIPKFDFPSDTKTGIFKSLINKLTGAVDQTAARFPSANQAWQQAKAIHAEKAALFDDPDVAKWIKLSDKNYSKDFLSSIDIDKIRKIEPVLKRTDEGRAILQQMKRELVEKTLENNFSVGTRFDKKQISRKLAELEPVLTPEELAVVEQLFKEAQTPGAKVASLGYKFIKYAKNPTALLGEASSIK